MAEKSHYRVLREEYQEMFGRELDIPDEYSREQATAILEQCVAMRKTFKQLKALMTLKGLFSGKKFDQFLDEWVEEDAR